MRGCARPRIHGQTCRRGCREWLTAFLSLPTHRRAAGPSLCTTRHARGLFPSDQIQDDVMRTRVSTDLAHVRLAARLVSFSRRASLWILCGPCFSHSVAALQSLHLDTNERLRRFQSFVARIAPSVAWPFGCLAQPSGALRSPKEGRPHAVPGRPAARDGLDSDGGDYDVHSLSMTRKSLTRFSRTDGSTKFYAIW